MSYGGLGAYYEATFRVLGQNINAGVDVPIEQAAQDAVNAALPQVLAQVPNAINTVVPKLTDAVKKQLPGLVNTVLPDFENAARKQFGGPVKAFVILSGVTAAASVITLLVLLKHVRAKG